VIADVIIKSALRKLLVLPSGGTPKTAQLADGLEALNDIVKLISGNSSLIYQDTREEIAINIGDQEFTLGLTGDYVTNKPVELIQASIRDGNYEYPLDRADVNTYASFYDKTRTDIPLWLYFRNTHPDSTFYFDVTTNKAYTLILTTMKELAKFPDGTTDIPLPDYYESYFKLALTVALAPEFGAANRVTPLMIQAAEDAKSTVIGKAIRINPSHSEITYINGYIDSRYYFGDYNR